MLEPFYSLPELAPLWRIADLCYGIPSPLHLFGRDGLVASLTSQRGSRQGCNLGTLLFCLGLQPILEEAARGLDNLTVSAYIDDIAAVGPLEQVSVFFERLSILSPPIGLAFSLPKSSVLWASDSSVPDRVQRWATGNGIPLVRGAVPLLRACRIHGALLSCSPTSSVHRPGSPCPVTCMCFAQVQLLLSHFVSTANVAGVRGL